MCNDCPFCFAFASENRCKVLTEMPQEPDEKCSFFKIPAEAEEDANKAFSRMLHLPKEQRLRIYKKYYKNNMEDKDDG